METLQKGLTAHKNENGFTIARLHYLADEDKTEEWAEKLRKTYPSLDTWNQEMELDFTKASGKRMYVEFTTELHISELTPIPLTTIWRGWDFGYGSPACVWAQVTPEGRLHLLGEVMGKETIINVFAVEVDKLSKKLFPGFSFKDAGDPAGAFKSDKSARTSIDIVRKLIGARIQSRRLNVKQGINIIRNLIHPRDDGFVRLKVDPKCKILIDGFLGGYTRDDDDDPIKDGYFDHLMDCVRYLASAVFNERTYNVVKPSHPFARSRPTASAVVGY